MIRGFFREAPRAKRPFVSARVTLPPLGASYEINFLVDTGADSTLLAPRDTEALGMEVTRLRQGIPVRGVGGSTPTVNVEAEIGLGASAFPITLRILAPRGRKQEQALRTIPSLLGRDILAHFALFLEERSGRVLLLEPGEVARLNLP